MIELLGVGVQDEQKAWRLRKACARFDPGTLSAVVAGAPADGAAVLDALSGRRIPEEGRVWVTRVPLMRETRGRRVDKPPCRTTRRRRRPTSAAAPR